MSKETTMPHKFPYEKPPYKEEWYIVEREDGTIEWDVFDTYFNTFSDVIGWDYLYPGKEKELKEKYEKIEAGIRNCLHQIMYHYNIDEEYILKILQEEIDEQDNEDC